MRARGRGYEDSRKSEQHRYLLAPLLQHMDNRHPTLHTTVWCRKLPTRKTDLSLGAQERSD
jgi:hypothetical protein